MLLTISSFAVLFVIGVAKPTTTSINDDTLNNKTRHRTRHHSSSHRNNHHHRLAIDHYSSTSIGCQDPIDLSDKFMTWFKESNLSVGNNEIIDDDWQPQTQLTTDESVACDQKPDTDSESTIMQRSLCPWEWR